MRAAVEGPHQPTVFARVADLRVREHRLRRGLVEVGGIGAKRLAPVDCFLDVRGELQPS